MQIKFLKISPVWGLTVDSCQVTFLPSSKSRDTKTRTKYALKQANRSRCRLRGWLGSAKETIITCRWVSRFPIRSGNFGGCLPHWKALLVLWCTQKRMNRSRWLMCVQWNESHSPPRERQDGDADFRQNSLTTCSFNKFQNFSKGGGGRGAPYFLKYAIS